MAIIKHKIPYVILLKSIFMASKQYDGFQINDCNLNRFLNTNIRSLLRSVNQLCFMNYKNLGSNENYAMLRIIISDNYIKCLEGGACGSNILNGVVP